ncbi:MAG: DinB family protein [Nitrospinae bacterium]|nr:DinB family protein [Nitrospinota bacterium]
MKELKAILNGLKNGPRLLRELITSCPPELLKKHRIPGKWCAHEHAVHFSTAQVMLNERIRRFIAEKSPEFVPYNPVTTTPKDELMKLDLKESLKNFARDRRKFLGMAKQLSKKDWHKNAKHPEYTSYTPYIMARHILLHDSTHMYRIEELMLSKDLGA